MTANSDELRRRVKEERSFGDAVAAFFRLVEQPDLTWRDLLDGLDHPGLIAEISMCRLHSGLSIPLKIPQSPDGFIPDRAVWTRILKEKIIPEDGLVASTDSV
jgi:hypothetical protein